MSDNNRIHQDRLSSDSGDNISEGLVLDDNTESLLKLPSRDRLKTELPAGSIKPLLNPEQQKKM